MNQNILAYTISLCLIFFFAKCKTDVKSVHHETKREEPIGRSLSPVGRSLSEILEDGKLKALTAYSSTSYFLYRGQPMGYEYELLKQLADYLGVELELHVSSNIDSLFKELNTGKVDIIAHGLTITSGRKKLVSFTDYLYLTHQVLVQRKPENWRQLRKSTIQKSLIEDAVDLIGDTVSVRRNSSYFQRLVNLSKEIGGDIIIDTLFGDLSTDEIIKMVVDGDIKYTVADDNIAHINASYYPILNIDVPISFSQRIAWAVRFNSTELRDTVNTWIEGMKDEVDYYVIYNKYFKNTKGFRKRSESDFYSINNNALSKYDDIIKSAAKKIGWDWRLLASLIYQESRFEPEADSWAGARGLMQMMPSTAKEMGVKNISNPTENINAGTKFLHTLWEKFDMIEDSVQRIKFTMASYNCGYYHVTDAQKLAEINGLDKNIWDNNVDEMIVELSYPKNYNRPEIYYGYVRGIEPYTYVKEIFERYDQYSRLIDI